MRTALLAILGILCVLIVSGCTSDDAGGGGSVDISGLSTEQIAEKVLEANLNLDTYRFDISSTFMIGMEFMGRSVATNISNTMEGYVDKSNERIYIDMVTSAEDAEGNIKEVNVKTLIVDDYAYAITDEGSFKAKLNESWNEKDLMNISLKLLELSEITLEGEDSFGGNNYWVIRAQPSLESFLGSGVTSTGSEETSLQITDAMKEAINKYEFKLWLNKQSLVIEKTELAFDLSAEGFVMKMYMEGFIRDINKPVPEELFEVDDSIPEVTGDLSDMIPDGGTDSSDDTGTDIPQTYEGNLAVSADFDRSLIDDNCGDTGQQCCESGYESIPDIYLRCNNHRDLCIQPAGSQGFVCVNNDTSECGRIGQKCCVDLGSFDGDARDSLYADSVFLNCFDDKAICSDQGSGFMCYDSTQFSGCGSTDLPCCFSKRGMEVAEDGSYSDFSQVPFCFEPDDQCLIEGNEYMCRSNATAQCGLLGEACCNTLNGLLIDEQEVSLTPSESRYYCYNGVCTTSGSGNECTLMTDFIDGCGKRGEPCCKLLYETDYVDYFTDNEKTKYQNFCDDQEGEELICLESGSDFICKGALDVLGCGHAGEPACREILFINDINDNYGTTSECFSGLYTHIGEDREVSCEISQQDIKDAIENLM
jgi:hypothetical protein